MGDFLKEAASEAILGRLNSHLGLMEMGQGDCPLEHQDLVAQALGQSGLPNTMPSKALFPNSG